MRQACGASVAFVISAEHLSDAVNAPKDHYQVALLSQTHSNDFFCSHSFIKPHSAYSCAKFSKVSVLPYPQATTCLMWSPPCIFDSTSAS